MHTAENEVISLSNQTVSYYKYGTLRRTELLPAAMGGAFVSGRTRDGTHINPMDSTGWRSPSSYYGSRWNRQIISGSYWLGSHLPLHTGALNYLIPGLAPLTGVPSGNWEALASSELERAQMQALSHLKDQTVNLSVAFKERQKTANAIGDAAEGLVNFYRDLRRGRIPRALKNWRDIPGHWLWYRYGITPTILDVYGAVEAIEKADNGTYDRYNITVRGKSQSEQKSPKVLSQTDTSFGRFYTVPCTETLRQNRLKYGARVRYDATQRSSTYLRLSEVGVTNPLEVAWELLPFSFVADWFLGIGDFISALDASQPWDYRGGTETIFVDWAGSAEYTGRLESILNLDQSGESTYFAFQRNVAPSFPFPTIVLKRNPLNLTRMADGLALISQVFKSRRYRV